jgi:uncharacterized protein (DUF2141 family)
MPRNKGMRINAFIPALLALGLFTLPASAATVKVTVDNILSDKGYIDVALCVADQFLGDRCTFKKSVPAETGSVTTTFKSVPEGIYAVQVHHDANANGKMDWDMLGLFPAEAYGFSRLGRLYATPHFEDAAFEVDRKTSMNVTLVNP